MSPEERATLIRIVNGLREGLMTNEQAIELLVQLGASGSPPPAEPTALTTRSTPDLSSNKASAGAPGKCGSTGFVAANATYTIPNSTMDPTGASGCNSTNTSAKDTTCSSGPPECVPGYYGVLPNPSAYANLSSSSNRSRTSPNMSNRGANCPSPYSTATSEYWANIDARMNRLMAAGRNESNIAGRSRSSPPAGYRPLSAVTQEQMRAFTPGPNPNNSSYGRMTPSYISPAGPCATPNGVQGPVIRQLNFSGLSGPNTPSFLDQRSLPTRGRVQGPAIRRLNFSEFSDSIPGNGNATFNAPCPEVIPPSAANGNWSSPQADPCSPSVSLPPMNGTYEDVSGGSGYASFEYMGSDGSTIYAPQSPSFFIPTPNAPRAGNMPMNSTHIRDAPPCPPPVPPCPPAGANATFDSFELIGGDVTFDIPQGQIGGNATFDIPQGQIGGNATFNIPQGQNATFNVPGGSSRRNVTFNVNPNDCSPDLGNASFVPNPNVAQRRLNFSPYADADPSSFSPGPSPQDAFSVYGQTMSTDQSGYASFEYMGSDNSSIYGSQSPDFYNPTPGARLGGNVPMNSTKIGARPCTPPPGPNGTFNLPRGQYALGNATLTVGQGPGNATFTAAQVQGNATFIAGPGLGNATYNAGSGLGNATYNAGPGLGNATYNAGPGLGNVAFNGGQTFDLDVSYSVPSARTCTPSPAVPYSVPSARTCTPTPIAAPPPPGTPVNVRPSTRPESVVTYLRPEDPYRCLRRPSPSCMRRLSFSDCVDEGTEGNPTP